METLLRTDDLQGLRKLLMLSVGDYKPQGEIVDLLQRRAPEPAAADAAKVVKLGERK